MNSADSRRLLSATAGVLLGKSIQMSDDVYQAMVSRGFRGDMRVMQNFQTTAKDWILLAALLTIAAITYMAGR